MLISLCLLLFAQDAEAARKAVGDFETKLHKIKEEERIPLIRAFFGALKDPITKLEALDMFDRRYVYVIPDRLHVELLRPLLKDADVAVRIRAAGASAYTHSGVGLADELKALLGETEPDAKVAALYAMGASGSPEFGGQLRAHLASTDVVVRRAAAGAYGHWTLAQSSALVPLLKDADADVRSIAAEQLGRAGHLWAADEIGLLLSDRESRVRASAIRALVLLQRRADLVSKRLNDDDPMVRATAAVGLGSMDAREHIDGVAKLLSSTDAAVRGSALAGLAQFRDVSVMRRLTTLLGDPDERFRRQVRDQVWMWAARIDADVLRRELDRLVALLGSEDVEERERAQRDLVSVRWRAIEPLKAAAGNAELMARAKATLEEIRWGEPMRALQKRLDEANTSSVRTFELVETTAVATKRWFPEVRVMTLRCSWQKPELSSVVWPRSYLLDACWDEPYEGDAGVNRLLERYAVKIASAEEAKEFVAFLGSLGIPGGVPQRDTLEVTKTDSGYEARRSFGKVADVYTLRIDNGQLRGVAYERK